MNVGSIPRTLLILVSAVLVVGCEYGPFEMQTRSLPGAITVDVNDPFYLNGDDQENQWYLDTINARQAWEQYAAIASDPVGGIALQTIPVAVIDSGIDGTHEDVAGVLARTGMDVVGGSMTPIPQGFPAGAYGIEHGTHVSGLIAAEGGNGRGIAGVAYNGWGLPAVSVVPVRALENLDGSLSDVITGILYGAGAAPGQRVSPARVLNLSLGADISTLDEAGVLIFESAVEEAWSRGVILVAAAGNGVVPDGQTGPQGPEGQPDGIDWPARFPAVIAVGSVDYASVPQNSPRSHFSDYGPQLELMAPGARSSGPNDGDTVGIISTLPSDPSNAQSLYGLQAGTSMAAPLVAGAAALVWSANPHLSADNVRRILQETAIDLGEPGWDEEFGYGLLNVAEALRVASTTPYGRYEGSSVNGSQPIATDSLSSRELRRSKQNAEYRSDLPAEFIVYLADDADPERLSLRILEIAPAARVEILGALPMGTALRVLVDTSHSTGVAEEELFEALRGDARVLSVVQNRLIPFGRP
jgi:subtilisin family serine protease